MRRLTQYVQNPAINGEPCAPASTPIYQTATFGQSDASAGDRYDYSRSGNPTRHVLEAQLARLEEAAHGFAFASGMAAIDAVVRLVPHGGTLVAGTDLYGGTHRLLTQIAAAEGRNVRLVNLQDERALDAALDAPDTLVLIETPTNPRLRIVDLRAVAACAHRNGARVAVDNTMLSPYLQRPLNLGADIVIHSATKHLGGHSDLTAGAVLTNDAQLAERIAFLQNATGTALAPFDSWLLLRGIKTMALRVAHAQSNATAIAQWLHRRSDVQRVNYPGLHDDHDSRTHAKQADGPGTVLSFETGSLERSESIVNALQQFAITVSFGGVASSIGLPCRMSHASIAPAERARLDLPADLIRISAGIEDGRDLIEDLEQAFAGASACETIMEASGFRVGN